MDKYFLLFFISASMIFAQSNHTSNLLDLKNQLNIDITNNNNYQDQKPVLEKKKAGLAIIYSLLLPGMGELYADNYSSGMYFTIADGVLWGTLIGFNTYGNWQKDNYKSFAESHGGVNLEGKDATYFAVIGEYVDIDQYNTEQELNRYFEDVYNVNTHYWNWGLTATRKEYREMWSSSENAFNNIRFIAGALILNRLISAINAARLVVAYNNELEDANNWNVSVNVTNHFNEPAFGVNFSTSF